MIYFQDGQRARVWEIEDKSTYALVKLGTSRKDKKTDKYKNSNWSFVRFVGAAYEKIDELSEKDAILLKGAGMSLEEYEDKDGNRAWPKNPQIVVFNWEFPSNDEEEEEKPAKKSSGTKTTAKKSSGKGKIDQPPIVDDEEELW